MFAASHVGQEIHDGQPPRQVGALNGGNPPLQFFRIYDIWANGVYVQFVSERLDPDRCFALVELREFGPGPESSVAERIVEAVEHVRHTRSVPRPYQGAEVELSTMRGAR